MRIIKIITMLLLYLNITTTETQRALSDLWKLKLRMYWGR